MIEFCKNAQQVLTFVYTREAREILVQHCLCVESAVLWSVEQVEKRIKIFMSHTRCLKEYKSCKCEGRICVNRVA